MTTMMTVVAIGGLGILAVAFVASVAFRRAPASLRHLVWLAALSAALALPLLEGADVELRIGLPTALAPLLIATPSVEELEATDPGSAVLDGVDGRHVAAGVAAEMRDAARRAPEPDIGVAAGSPADGATSPPLDPPDDAVRPPSSTRVAGRVTAELAASAPPGSVASRSEAPRAEASDARVSGPRPSGVRWSDLGTHGLRAYGSWASGVWAFGLWSLGALVLLMGTLIRHFQARSLTVRDVAAASPRTQRLVDEGKERLGLDRPVRVAVSDRIDVPATWGALRPTILLPREHTDWADDTLRRVLLHELAHVQRGDCATYLVGELTRAIHWPNPMAWLALRRLRVESERASDDRVVEVTEVPSDYAGDLVTMLRSLGRRPPLPSAAVAMARPSGLSVRIKAILDPLQARGRVGRPAAAVVGAVATLLALAATVVTPVADAQEPEESPGMPTMATDPPGTSSGEATSTAVRPSALGSASGGPGQPQERPCAFGRDGEHRSMSTHIDDEQIEIRWETDDCRVEIDIEGAIEFSADDQRIESLAPDGLFQIEERIGRGTRRARIEGRPDGGMDRRYWQDGDRIAWGPAVDRWLAGLLPQIFRHSTINAEARVRRMLEEGGPDRVFAEVEQIPSDHVARTYLEIMMEATELDEDGYRRVIEAAADIESDHGSAELMMSVIERAGLRPSFQDPLLAASEGLESDHQRTRVLGALLESPLSASQLDAVLRSASSIDSDHNLGELLSVIARAGRLDDAGRASFLQALRSIESDHEQAQVIHAFLDSGRLSDDELAAVLAMSGDIESDHQRAEVLQRVARDYPLTGAQVTAYLESAARIESDHEKASTATAIIGRADVDSEQLGLVLRIADDIGSDHQRAEVLRRVLERRELSPAEVSRLAAVAGGIDSDHELSQVLSLLVREQPLGDEELATVLEVARGIGSSHQRAELLLGVADRYQLEGRARDLYRSLADGMSGRDRERALAAIVR